MEEFGKRSWVNYIPRIILKDSVLTILRNYFKVKVLGDVSYPSSWIFSNLGL